MATYPDGRPLIGASVRLDRVGPTGPPDLPELSELFEALDDERVWAGGFAGGPAARPTGPAGLAALLPDPVPGGRVAYLVRSLRDTAAGPAGTVLGTSSLGDAVLADERVHLGWTAYRPAVWGTGINVETKLLLLEHVFTDCGFGRVKIQTDARNARSQAAIARLGATREGVLRRHKVRADGTFRDTVVFSIVVDEWPAVRDGLRARLAALGRPD
ncbi:GNAT family N-acetyltransferase [Nakamurella leprariae]|uniref:GNAT family N-acetyltransferase n=1 Tax=Nakamurella leprariae TaxID=2803911 RepID=UPI002E2D5E94|nr:GNAT family protein [Nakamurella leprariae]